MVRRFAPASNGCSRPANRELITDELVEVRYGIYTRPRAERTIENVLVLQDPEVRRQYTWTEEWCARIAAPTLIFWTDQDPTGPPSEGELLEQWIPGSLTARAARRRALAAVGAPRGL